MGIFSNKKRILSLGEDLLNYKLGGQISIDKFNEVLNKLENIKEIYEEIVEEIDTMINSDFQTKISFSWTNLLGNSTSEFENINVIKNSLFIKGLSAEQLTNLKIRYSSALQEARIYFLNNLRSNSISMKINFINDMRLKDTTKILHSFVVVSNAENFFVNYERIDAIITSLKYSEQYTNASENGKWIKK